MFASNSLILCKDFKYRYMKDLKIGDIILNHNFEEMKITKITKKYKKGNSMLLTNHSIALTIDNSVLLPSSLLRSKNKKLYLEKVRNINVSEIKENSLLITPKYKLLNNIFSDYDYWLLGKIIDKGILKNDILLKDSKVTTKELKEYSSIKNIRRGINNNNRTIYIENNNQFNDSLNEKLHKRGLPRELMLTRKNEIELFLFSYLEENNSYNYSSKEFTLMTNNKQIILQLSILVNMIYNRVPRIDYIKKNHSLKTDPSYTKKDYKLYFNINKKETIPANKYNLIQQISVKNIKNKTIEMIDLETDNKGFFIVNGIISR